jgi:hypothetical protein
MRKFIISDIHGNGKLYYSCMSYMNNISKYDDVTLYINGDLIDRGNESAEILLDLIKRIKSNDNPFKIEYLGGNHELMMYQVFEKRRKGLYVSFFNDWYLNGGRLTDVGLEEILKEKNKILEVVDFIGGLKLYHKFDEQINGKNIVLVHACSPTDIKDECDLLISEKNRPIYYVVWTRKKDPLIPFKCRIGNKKYFSIVGHSVNEEKFGYYYDEDENYLNIDGGSAYYVCGHLEYNHFPLVEIKDGYLKILTFNSNNEILFGNNFINYQSIPISKDELDYDRSLLDKNVLVKKLKYRRY